eukprot:scaffold28558_cov101-Isochrysis_galbana.AAC.2
MPHRTTPHSDIASGCCVIKNSIRAHQHTAYARPAAEGLRRNGLASSSYRRKPEPSPSNMSKAHSMSCCGPSKPSLRMACANSTLSMDPDELPSQEWKTSMMLSPVASSASASCSIAQHGRHALGRLGLGLGIRSAPNRIPGAPPPELGRGGRGIRFRVEGWGLEVALEEGHRIHLALATVAPLAPLIGQILFHTLRMPLARLKLGHRSRRPQSAGRTAAPPSTLVAAVHPVAPFLSLRMACGPRERRARVLRLNSSGC